MRPRTTWANGPEDLLPYKAAYPLAMRIFELTKLFPREERYSLTDQIRRSSRSICANLSEAFRKRRYVNNLVSKLSDSDAECAETITWLHFARDCGYLSAEDHDELLAGYQEVGRLIGWMMNNPARFLPRGGEQRA